MELRPVMGTDLKVSRLIMGTMTFGSQVSEGDAEAMVEIALDAGINMFDTAAAYTGGQSERILGSILKRKRSKALVATKVHPHANGLDAAAIHSAVDASLERLQRDEVDLYYLHQPDWRTPIDETLSTMADLVRVGKVRHIGVSNYAAWQICDIRHRSAGSGSPMVTFSQQMYNLLARRLDEEYAAFSESVQLFDIAYNPLAGGLLTGKHTRASRPAAGSRFSQESYRTRYWNDEQFDAIEQLSAGAQSEGLSLVDLSFRWLLTRPLVDAVLIGASSLEHLRTNLAAARSEPLPERLVTLCDDVWRRLRGTAPAYNR